MTPHRLNRLHMLEILAERDHWRYTILLAELCQRLDAAPTTVRNSLRYAQDFRYIQRKGTQWSLTSAARHQLAHYGRLEGAEGFRFATFISGQPKRGFTRWQTPDEPSSSTR